MADDEAKWGLVEPFDIDDGELDGVSRQTAFCLGYEFCEFRRALERGGPIRQTAHTENAGRLKRMCIRRGRKFKAEPCPGCEADWTYLDVAGADGQFLPAGPTE